MFQSKTFATIHSLWWWQMYSMVGSVFPALWPKGNSTLPIRLTPHFLMVWLCTCLSLENFPIVSNESFSVHLKHFPNIYWNRGKPWDNMVDDWWTLIVELSQRQTYILKNVPFFCCCFSQQKQTKSNVLPKFGLCYIFRLSD